MRRSVSRVCLEVLFVALLVHRGVGCVFDPGGMPWSPAAETECANGLDDDGDGLVDCADGDCASSPACGGSNNNNGNSNTNPGPEYCGNGVDDDGDGLVDCADPQCALAIGCQVEDCSNGVDDNGDGLADCADPDCAGEPHCQPESCGNGVDDDADGLVDCDDTDCLSTPECGVCHPITNAGCAAGRTCYLRYNDDWFGTCLTGSGGSGQWDFCSEYTDCLPGYYCSGNYYECWRVCHPGGNDCASVSGTSCQAFSDYGSASPWGVCI